MKKKVIFVIIALFLGVFSVFAGSARFANASGLCTINSFYPSQNNLTYGGSTTLIINSIGCQSMNISGGTYNSPVGNNNSFNVGPLYSTTTFFITGYDYNNNVTYASTIVTVGGIGSGVCTLNNFYATPTQVSSGGYATLNWSTTGCSNVNVIGPGVNSNTNSNSMQVGPIYGSSVYTITGSSYSNNINQTVTISNDYSSQQNLPVITTGQATNVSGGSATLNGYINSNTYNCIYDGHSSSNCNFGNTTYYFQYGTNQFSLTGQTPIQTYSNTNGNVSAYVNNLQPYTTYFYRLVITNNSATKPGDIQQFTTNNSLSINPISTYITPIATTPTPTPAPVAPIIINRIIPSDTNINNSGSKAVSLNIVGTPQSVVPGNTISYLVTYQNTSAKTISNATLNVMLPSGVVFQQSSFGLVTTNNTVIANIGTLSPGQQGTVIISGTTANSQNSNNNLSATATLAYTNSDSTQDSVVAYSMNNLSGNQTNTAAQNNITGFALAGSGFFPTTLTEWLIILAIIFGLIIASRELTKPKNPTYNVPPVNYPPSNYDHH